MIYKRVPCPKCGRLIADNWLVRHLNEEHPPPLLLNVDELDPECRSLLEAMNEFSGIRAVDSCCGHWQRAFEIWFVADDLDSLPPLLYWIDVCHSGCPGWHVVAQTDCGMSPVVFRLEGPIGAFADAETIATKMREYLRGVRGKANDANRS